MRSFVGVWQFLAVSLVLPIAAVRVAPVSAEEPDDQTYTLRYALKSGEKLRYEVTHVAKTKTRIQGEEEISNVHTTSQRHWDVKAAEDDGVAFDHVIESVEMTQQQGEQDEIRWASDSDEPAPKMFSKVAEQIGQKLSTIKINPRGQEIDREDFGGTKASLGMGSLTLALPEEPMKVGATWTVPRQANARTPEGEVKKIKIRELYKLEKVRTGVATLSIRSEVLTPIDDESVKAQIVQQLSNGEIRFDVDNGRMLSKELNWDETVVGFQGPNSLMEYRAKMTEKLLLDSQRTARLP